MGQDESGNVIAMAAGRYWRLQRIWRGLSDPGDMTVEDLILALNDLQCYRGSVAMLAMKLLDDVIHDRRTPIQQAQTA